MEWVRRIACVGLLGAALAATACVGPYGHRPVYPPPPGAPAGCTLNLEPMNGKNATISQDSDQLRLCSTGTPGTGRVDDLNEAIARNVKTPPDVLTRLGQPGQFGTVRCAVAANYFTPVDVIVAVVETKPECAAGNTKTPLPTLCVIAQADNASTAYTARMTIEYGTRERWEARCGLPVPTAPMPSFGDGAWLVGPDIAPGTYHARATADCHWERRRSFNPPDVIASGSARDPGPLTILIEPTDFGFITRGCGTWSR